MIRMVKIQAILAAFVIVLAIAGGILYGLVIFSRQELLAENLEKGKAMLAEEDYQSARVYLSMFEDEGTSSMGYNLYGYVTAAIAYHVYLGNGDINKLQQAMDALDAINMNNLGNYSSNARELKETVGACLASYNEQVEAQEQAAAAAAAAAEAKAKAKQPPAKANTTAAASPAKTEKAESAAAPASGKQPHAVPAVPAPAAPAAKQ